MTSAAEPNQEASYGKKPCEQSKQLASVTLCRRKNRTSVSHQHRDRVDLSLAALRYLGRNNVTSEVISNLRNMLTDEEYKELRSRAKHCPSWIMEALNSNAALPVKSHLIFADFARYKFGSFSLAVFFRGICRFFKGLRN